MPPISDEFAIRLDRLEWLREDKTGGRLRDVSAFYRDNPANFIDDWGCTVDPRLVEKNLPALVPFRLFPRQREWVEWATGKWRAGEPGLTEKSRDTGVSWLAVALACTLCIFNEGMIIGFGSRKEEYVDKAGSPKALFWKGREFMDSLPPEFRAGWSRKDSPHLQLRFPARNSIITGEAGDNIGRGDRSAIYFVDEAAFLERPQLIENSLSQTTNCRIDISTPKGMDNPFAKKRWSWPQERIFIYDWRDDPRKDEAWYERQKTLLDPVTIAQEIDRSYTASVVGVLIPGEWVQACVDLDKKLGFEVRGERRAALDVADEGDLLAFCDGRGVRVNTVTSWSGAGSDMFASVQKAFALCDVLGIPGFDYDADGLGAGVRGDARVLNENRKRKLEVTPYKGSGAVIRPDDPIPDAAPKGLQRDAGEMPRLNGDYFENLKAQAWFSVRAQFQRGFRAWQMHQRGEDWRAAYNVDDLIVLAGNMPELATLTQQLSQPVYAQSKAGKMMVNKAPGSVKSPNHADALVIRYAPREPVSRYRLDAWAS